MTHSESPERESTGHSEPKLNAPDSRMPEPWLRGTLSDVPVLTRAVLHALELAREDVERWCGGLSDEELNARPGGVAPVAFHLRHIVRSADRLLTYAEARQLSPEQLAALKSELAAQAAKEELFAEFRAGIESAARRVRAFNSAQFDEPRTVGKLQLPTTVGSLLIHVADHTQRHVGQAITTAKIATAARV
ncbi:MAG TPA: DinB family protein [Candidatus Dormibacteraeota bacterium]|nr:DinB family protein [Candidatus Dormibacteraeota bacterium]